MNSVLDIFCDGSGAKVNKSKTLIYFSKNTVVRKARNIRNILGFSVAENLGIYLGTPFTHSGV